MSDSTEFMSLAELAGKSGLPGRTIRFYIARNLLPGPLKAGRDAAYGTEHLERLKTIAQLQGKGLTLHEIGHQLAGATSAAAAPEAAPWWHYHLGNEVTVQVRADLSPWRLKEIRNWLATFPGPTSENNPK
jgi:DNA-binding transcriptional MerR regulator